MATREVLLRMVRSCREARKITKMMETIPEYNGEGVFEKIYGDLMDAIYLMLEERTDVLEESVTFAVINSRMSDEDCAGVLETIMKARAPVVRVGVGA